MKDEEEAQLDEGASLKVEEHERTRMKVEEGVHLALESIRRVEGEQHAKPKTEG